MKLKFEWQEYEHEQSSNCLLNGVDIAAIHYDDESEIGWHLHVSPEEQFANAYSPGFVGTKDAAKAFVEEKFTAWFMRALKDSLE